MSHYQAESETDRQKNLSQEAFDIVAIAASAGGLNALSEVLSKLPANFPAAIVIVQHLDPRHRSLMADILSRRTPLQVKQAGEGDPLELGTVYIAPPNRHLLVNTDKTLSLTQSELVHFVRPSADLLFDSVAASHKERAIAVVLTGTGNDGSMGVRAIDKMGGTVIAQDKETAKFFGMPSAAIKTGAVDIFTPLSLQHRIFRRVPSKNRRDRLLDVTQSAINNNTSNVERQQRLQDLAFDAGSVAQLIVDFNGNLVLANTPARSMFGINLLDIGRPLQDLEISYRPLELRSHIDQIYGDRRLAIVRDVIRHLPEGNTQYLDVHFNPLEEGNSEILGVSISFVDVSRYHELQKELQRSNQELETANEELQSSNEELETTNEELQSTNEELETTNEELQSTNEELETMNEELQSTNEELQTINDELRQRTSELDQTNAFLNSILGSLRAGVVVVNTQFNILTWNDEAENMWGLRFDEVKGHSLLSLDIGLPVAKLREPIRNCLADNGNRQGMIVEAINRRGRSIQCRLSFNPLIGLKKERQGVILLMEAMGTIV